MRILLLLPLLGLAGTSPVEINKRIIGGRACTQTEAQHQVLVTDDTFICGGSLLSPKWVLTAAHCNSPALKVYFQQSDAPYDIEKKIDPGYNDFKMLNDIMLVHLKKAAPPDTTTLYLPTQCEEYANAAPAKKNLLVAGLGATHDDGKIDRPKINHCVEIETKPCPGNQNPPITSEHFCAGWAEKKTGWGDSGGGLVFNTSAQREVYGVVQSDCGPHTLSIFTSVCHHLAWIKEVTHLP